MKPSEIVTVELKIYQLQHAQGLGTFAKRGACSGYEQ